VADTHEEVDETLPRARDLMDCVRKLAVEWSRLKVQGAKMATMKDGDGSASTHFQTVVDLYGPTGANLSAQLTSAKTIYDEINSTLGNSAALEQLLAKLG